MVHSHSGAKTAEIPTVDTLVDMKLSRFSGRDEDRIDCCLRCVACGAVLVRVRLQSMRRLGVSATLHEQDERACGIFP